jgi:hypothetical protein
VTKPDIGRLLRPRGPYEAHATLAALAAHTVPRAARTDLAARTHSRCIRLDRNQVAMIRLHFEPHGVHLTAHSAPRAVTHKLRGAHGHREEMVGPRH